MPKHLGAVPLILGLLLASTGSAHAAEPLSWGAPQLVDHQVHPTSRLNEVACPSTTLCVAIDQGGHIMTSTNPAGGASAWTLTGIDAPHELKGVACPSTTLCLAVDQDGHLLTSKDPTGGSAAWSSATLVSPGGLTRDVACVSASLCFVVSTEGLLYTTDPAGGPAAWKNSGGLVGGESVQTITCAGASLCLASFVGGSGSLLASTNPTGGESAWTGVLGGSEATDWTAACPSTSLCVAGETIGTLMTSTTPAKSGSWTGFSLTGGADIPSIACPSSALCVATASDGDVFSSTNPTGGKTAWTKATIDGFNSLLGVACPSTSLCVTVDSEGNILTSTNPTSGTWSFGSVDTSTVDTPNELTGLSCPTTSFCAGTDSAGNILISPDPSGGTWSEPLPVHEAGFAGLDAISCASSSLCVAVGEPPDNLLASSNPGDAASWQAVEAGGFNVLPAVACPSSNLCVATDFGGVVITANPTGGAGAWHFTKLAEGTLTAVSCPTAGFCVAVGGNGGNEVLTSISPTGGAAAWKHTSLTGASGLLGISCASPSFCSATDIEGDVFTSSDPRGVGIWTKAHIAAMESSFDFPIACPSSTLCVAVDRSGNALSSTNPLGGAATWTAHSFGSGHTPSAVACPTVLLCLAGDREGDIVVGRGSGLETEPPHQALIGEAHKATTPPSEPGGGGHTAGSGVSAATLRVLLKRLLVRAARAAQVGSLLKQGGLSFSFAAPEAGSLSLQWYYLAKGAKLAQATEPVVVAQGKTVFAGAGKRQLRLRLTSRGKRLLRRQRRGQIAAKATFRPFGGAIVRVDGRVAIRATKAANAQVASARLPSVRYLEKHCPIAVPINIYAVGYKSANKHGVAVHGRLLPGGEVAQYNWTLSKHVRFCGIVGVWYGPRYVSLRPTVETAQGGMYVDPSPRYNATATGSMQKFYVFAQPR